MPDAGGGKVTAIDGNMIVRAVGAVRRTIEGVSNAWFGPGQPIAPLREDAGGRQMDYPYGVNIQYNPRSDETTSFSELRALADNLPLLRAAIETRKDQIQNVDWIIRPKKKKKKGDKATTEDPRVEEITQFLQYPDREHDFSTWLRALMEEMLVTDAACLEPVLTRGDDLYSLNWVDGATIKRLIDENGRTPEAPNPAYQQILHGVPAADFSRDELMYLPRNMRVNRFYGYSPVEQIILTVNIALRRDLHMLNYYTAGSIPDAIASLPKEWTIEQVKAFQEYWDFLISGNSAQRRMMKFVPGGNDFKMNETKQPPLKDQYDEWLARIICWALSVAVSPLVSQVNRATGETMRVTANEEGLQPTLLWVRNFMNLAIAKYFGCPDLEFAWEAKEKGDLLKIAQADDYNLRNGSSTLDEVREARGDDPLGFNEPMIYLPTGPVPLRETLDQAKEDILNPPEIPETLGGPKLGPDGKLLPPDNGGSGDAPPTAGDTSGKPEVGKSAAVPFQKARKPKRTKGLNYERPAARQARRNLKRIVAAGLRKVAKNVASQVRSSLEKADEDNKKRAKRIADEVDLSGLSVIVDPTQKQLDRIAQDSSKIILAQMGVEKNSDLVDQVNTDAADWAKFRAAEMVGMRYDEDGDLVPATRAEYRIDDATREGIRDTIYNGLEDNIGLDEIISDLEDSYAFSPERAELIARTEITRANNQASLISARDAKDQTGLGVKKVWLPDDDPCEICQENADAGAIDLDDDFPSGDDAAPAHPRCECTLVYEVDETQDDQNTDDEE